MASRKKRRQMLRLHNGITSPAKTTQSAVQKPILWQQEVTRYVKKKTKKTEQGIFQTGSHTKHETCQEIFMIIFFLFSLSIFSYKMLKI